MVTGRFLRVFKVPGGSLWLMAVNNGRFFMVLGWSLMISGWFYIVLGGFSCFSTVPGQFFMISGGSFMVDYSSRSVLYDSRWVSMVVHCSRSVIMILGWFLG